MPHKSKLPDEASNRIAQVFAASNLPTPVVAKINKKGIEDHSRYDSVEKECLTLLTKYPQVTESSDYSHRRSTANFQK